MSRLFPLLLCSLLLLPCVFSLCAPRLGLSLPQELVAGVPINATLASWRPNTSFVAVPLASTLDITGANETLTLVAPEGSSDQARVLFFVVWPDGCVATQLYDVAVNRAPSIEASIPASDTLKIPEGKPFRFSIQTNASTLWLLDGKIVASDIPSYTYLPEYNESGLHTVLALASARGLFSNRTWNVSVSNVNRQPFFVAGISGLILPIGASTTINLSEHFVDPDGQQLSFSAQSSPPLPGFSFANLSIKVWKNEASLLALGKGMVFVRFGAVDPLGASVSADPVKFVVENVLLESRSPFCGDGLCIAPEECGSCRPDCAVCDAKTCTPQWTCEPWGPCLDGFAYRTCAVTNGCANDSTRPPEAKACVLPASCSDNRRNGRETGLDCGGVCAPCPTCSDGIQNQQEEEVDCGGLCIACPSCADQMKNQDESDIDCGGVCAPCMQDASCNAVQDCVSLVCDQGRCADASCTDGILNQDEEGTDCGPSCWPCPSCIDHVQNQQETRVDCGGPCVACPSCKDRVKNQGERLVDCGGPCNACTLRNYGLALWRYVRWVFLVFFLVFFLFWLHTMLFSRMLFLFSHGKAIHFFYEDGPTYWLVKTCRSLNPWARPLLRERSMVERIALDLQHVQGLKEETIRSAILGKLRALYASMLNVPLGFEFEHLVLTIRHSSLPFSVKVILLRNTKILYLAERTKLYTPDHALRDAIEGLEELQRAL